MKRPPVIIDGDNAEPIIKPRTYVISPARGFGKSVWQEAMRLAYIKANPNATTAVIGRDGVRVEKPIKESGT